MLVVLVTHIETFSYLKLEQSGAVAGCAAQAWWMFWASNNGQNLPSFAPLCSQWGAPEHKPATNWSSWDTDMKIYRTLFFSQNFFVHELLCDLTDFTCTIVVIWIERQHFPPWQEQECKGGAGRGSDSFVEYKTNRKRRHLAGVETETKWFVKNSCSLILKVSGGAQTLISEGSWSGSQ